MIGISFFEYFSQSFFCAVIYFILMFLANILNNHFKRNKQKQKPIKKIMLRQSGRLWEAPFAVRFKGMKTINLISTLHWETVRPTRRVKVVADGASHNLSGQKKNEKQKRKDTRLHARLRILFPCYKKSRSHPNYYSRVPCEVPWRAGQGRMLPCFRR